MFSAAAYAAQLRALMPKGLAWPEGEGSQLAQLLRGIAEEFSRIDVRADALIEESDPRTALEMLGEWERMAGLPDPCFGQPDNIPERQVAVTQRITGMGGQSRAYFIELAASLGFPVEIEEFRPGQLGQRIGTTIGGDEWAHVWRVNVLPIVDDIPDNQFYLAQARCGDHLGVRLRGWGSIKLECLINRHKPAHSIVLFAYRTEPEALFWIDFTT